jgi:hypothetical protein
MRGKSFRVQGLLESRPYDSSVQSGSVRNMRRDNNRSGFVQDQIRFMISVNICIKYYLHGSDACD